MKGNLWFTTYLGKYFDLGNIQLDMIEWDDIAVSLSRQCRFNGHTKWFYSVAEHSCHVADLLPDHFAVYGLLHDAHEAYMGDITAPMKNLLFGTLGDSEVSLRTVQRVMRDHFKTVEYEVDTMIYRKAGILPPTGEIQAAVKRADLTMLATERRDLFPGEQHTRPWLVDHEQVQPADLDICGWDPETAASEFMLKLSASLGEKVLIAERNA